MVLAPYLCYTRNALFLKLLLLKNIYSEAGYYLASNSAVIQIEIFKFLLYLPCYS